MQVFNILDPTLDIFQSRCLEASAGTGKTFAIEHLFIRFLLESNPPIDLSEILAVTFTRDATQEMRQRIRENLEAVQKSLEGEKKIDWPYLKSLDNPKKALQRTRDALIKIDELQIFTIHGFCHRMLREFSMEANVHFGSAVADQFHHESAMRKIVEDFLQNENHAFAHEVGISLSKMRYDTDRLIMEIVKEMQKKEQTVEKVDWTSLFSSLADDGFQIDRFKQDFFTLAPRYKRLDPDQYLDQIELLGGVLEKKGKNDLNKLLQQKNWFLEKMHEGNSKAKASSLELNALHYPGLFSKLHKVLLPKLLEASDSELCIKRVAQQCRRLWEIKNTINEQISPDELLKKMEQVLEKDVFADLIRKKYRAVIVDEFQDTDPTQWKIFQKLFLQHPQCFFYLVGDPKQSIYGFRSADIYTYMQAIEELGNEKKFFLNTNFRSNPKLIDALNALFTKIPHWLSLPSSSQPLGYQQVNAGRTDARLQEEPIQFFFTEACQGKEKTWPTKTTEEKKLFPYIASEIIRLKNHLNIRYGEIAILVKDRFQARRLVEHLDKWNLPAVMQRSAHLAETEGFFVMEQLLQTAAYLTEDSVKSFLLLLGFSQQTIEENPNKLREIFSLFSLLQEKGFCTFFPQFLQQHLGNRTIYEFLVQYRESLFFLQFRQAAEILMEISLMTPEDLYKWFCSLRTISTEENPHLQFHGDEGSGKINIMTIFASKGLEFEVVFALGVATTSFFEDEEEKEAEKMRQLYVALTRAREKIYIPFVFHEDETNPFKGTSALEVFFSKIEGYPLSLDKITRFINELPIESKWIEEIPIRPLVEKKQPAKLNPAKNITLDFPIKTLDSFSSLSMGKPSVIINELYLSQDLNEKTLHTLPLGSETGIIIHTIFEKVFSSKNLSIHHMVEEELKKSSLSDWTFVIETMVHEILHMPLIKSFALKDLAPGNYFQEMEFLFSEGHQFIKGFADLVFQEGGKYYLLDWKTNWLGIEDADYNQNNIDKCMAQHDYFLQAKLYAEALKRYVKLFDNRPFNDVFGGAIYVFLRGKKAYHFVPDGLDR